MELMFLMVQSMRGEEGSVMGEEVVRSGAPDLPDLLPWASTGPLQLGDWMLLLSPIISDLSTTSQDWVVSHDKGSGGMLSKAHFHVTTGSTQS
jgi:hypothetical protein